MIELETMSKFENEMASRLTLFSFCPRQNSVADYNSSSVGVGCLAELNNTWLLSEEWVGVDRGVGQLKHLGLQHHILCPTPFTV